ncbi:hypothetical protein ACRAWD_15035 [Caulobacter segnis]
MGKLHAKSGAPVTLTLITGAVVALVGGFLPLDQDRRAVQCRHPAGLHLRGGVPDGAAGAPPRTCRACSAARPPDRRALAVVGCLYFMASLPLGTLVLASWPGT